jgi:hypothetical protein
MYNDDIKKIRLFMNEGDAASWKEQLLKDALTQAQATNTNLNLGSYMQFKHDLQEVFVPYNSPGDALKKMKVLWIKKDNSIDEHIAKFRMLVFKSKFDKSSPVIINFFGEILRLLLQQWIKTLKNLSKKLDNWYEYMGQIHQNYPKVGTTKQKFFLRKERDPNTMDIDCMSIDKQKKLMQDEKCFRCKKPGHILKEFPLKNEPQKKMNGMEMHKHVESLMASLGEEEKENFWKESEDADFWHGELCQHQFLLA